jgi:hypothetical protein
LQVRRSTAGPKISIWQCWERLARLMPAGFYATLWPNRMDDYTLIRRAAGRCHTGARF